MHRDSLYWMRAVCFMCMERQRTQGTPLVLSLKMRRLSSFRRLSMHSPLCEIEVASIRTPSWPVPDSNQDPCHEDGREHRPDPRGGAKVKTSARVTHTPIPIFAPNLEPLFSGITCHVKPSAFNRHFTKFVTLTSLLVSCIH